MPNPETARFVTVFLLIVAAAVQDMWREWRKDRKRRKEFQEKWKRMTPEERRRSDEAFQAVLRKQREAIEAWERRGRKDALELSARANCPPETPIDADLLRSLETAETKWAQTRDRFLAFATGNIPMSEAEAKQLRGEIVWGRYLLEMTRERCGMKRAFVNAPEVHKGSVVNVVDPYYQEHPEEFEHALYISKHGLLSFLWNTPPSGGTLREGRLMLLFMIKMFFLFPLAFFVLPSLAAAGWIFEWFFGWNPVGEAATWCGSHLGWLMYWLFGSLIAH